MVVAAHGAGVVAAEVLSRTFDPSPSRAGSLAAFLVQYKEGTPGILIVC